MSENAEAEKKVPPAVAARLASMKARKEAGLVGRTSVVPLWLDRADHLRAHEACHASAGVWNRTVSWLRDQWEAGESPGKEDIRRFVTSLPGEARPFHAHTAQAIAYDLWDAVATSRTNRAQGVKARAPWREKKYRPLSFTAGFGWRVTPEGRLALSLGRGRGRIVVPLPGVTLRDGRPVPPKDWGEIRLCWDRNARAWSLHIAYSAPAEALPGPVEGRPTVTVAIDEGIINPMTLAAKMPDGTMKVEVLGGRQGRSAKRYRNKVASRLTSRMSRCKNGSRKHRRLVAAKKKVEAKTERRLHDFDHQVSAKAEQFTREVHAEWTEHHKMVSGPGTVVGVRLVAGDVRGIERNTNKKRRASRSTRQQLSQWSRGRQEDFLQYKTGLKLEHINEAHSSQTCPKCHTRTKVRGREYVCKNPTCGFRCHRDAVGGVNIHTLADNDGTYVPDPDLRIEVTYRRSQTGWSPLQRSLHAYHQNVLGRSGAGARREERRSAQNRASRTSTTSAGVAVDSASISDDTTTRRGAGRALAHVA
ncbi:RNA-guided endonuclease InsQ/TnpB family protein [Streptomyces brasiliensis]|uniref:Transposase n=1 Tax=Streptomyces brasiliensis TaxID=1954 RepID=A0A917P7B9_9ACTN|nr:zinc ribbon domain-containing protein [Streptomyces brasiliensis]GGJ65275.1 transposase [Streptomyces brasiliensis]